MKKIPGFSGLYATRDGRIYSKRIHKYLNLSLNERSGYLQVHLDKKTYRVNRIIAITFLENPNNLPCVGHRDNDRTNNRVDNLYWCTHKENTQQCIRDGRFKPGGRDILDEFSINCLLYEYNLGKPRSILKKKFGISDSAITRIINLKSKPKFGNYRFKAIYQDIIRDYQEGMLVRDICNKYSIGHTTLNNYLRRLNIIRHR